jgi:hypothetical protein
MFQSSERSIHENGKHSSPPDVNTSLDQKEKLHPNHSGKNERTKR